MSLTAELIGLLGAGVGENVFFLALCSPNRHRLSSSDLHRPVRAYASCRILILFSVMVINQLLSLIRP